MINKAILRLEYLCTTIPQLLIAIDEQTFSEKPQPDKWSKKQIIGHLIDSATNNHQRFVRTQFEVLPVIRYDQNKWNEYNFYNDINAKQIISFWISYNLHLLELIKHISINNLKKKCIVGTDKFTLEFLITDYVEHLEHHLRQVVTYS